MRNCYSRNFYHRTYIIGVVVSERSSVTEDKVIISSEWPRKEQIIRIDYGQSIKAPTITRVATTAIEWRMGEMKFEMTGMEDRMVGTMMEHHADE